MLTTTARNISRKKVVVVLFEGLNTDKPVPSTRGKGQRRRWRPV